MPRNNWSSPLTTECPGSYCGGVRPEVKTSSIGSVEDHMMLLCVMCRRTMLEAYLRVPWVIIHAKDYIDELVKENDVDHGIVLTSPTEAEKAYSFVHPTHNVVIDRFMNLPQEFDLGEHLVAKNSRKKVNQLNNRINELDRREKVIKDSMTSLSEMNKTREKSRCESIDQLNADDIMKFQAWLDVGEVMLKGQLREDSSLSSHSPPEDANI
ncbi:hypothetical protein CQW23_09379 [Capsicum baccatum]|uniref:Uncharacterized protein n=1 Tax=Capsicum baccatum TaxID=33114 RepID=A0A2G2WWN7_CAPBA|nr:hypothetical protein CQW23_09379 [Capsicum baccatum]